MTTTWQYGPLHQIDRTLARFSWNHRRLVGKHTDPGGYLETPGRTGRVDVRTISKRVGVDPHRRTDTFGEPVERDGREQEVSRECAFEVAATIAPTVAA